METDSHSIKKAAAATTPPTAKTLLTPGTPGGRKQVGFAKTRPVLIIPPPGQRHELRASRPATATSPYTAGTGNVSSPASNHMYNRKASAFVFEQLHGIKDFTKSGLGVGEKCAYWLYNKLRSWSRKWFTHMFLTIVLLLYTIGGALIFEWVEGQNEKHIEDDLRVIRKNVIRDLQNLSKGMQDVYLKNDYEGQAVQLMMDYEQELLSWHMKHKQYVGTGSNPQKKWNFWNSVVYCGTIYTTIAAVPASRPKITQSLDIMDPPHVPIENASEQSEPKIDEKSIDMARIEALVTPEQVLSASVAKKRRTFTKKRTTSANKRDPTPMREINEKADITTTDEEVPEVRPKTPERRRRRRTLGDSIGRQNGTKSEPEVVTDFEPETSVKKSSSIPRQVLDEFMKRESLIADFAQTEVAAFLTKTKKSIEKAANRGRDRFKKIDKEQVKRSQSAPHTFTQEELIESFRKAQLLDVDTAPQRKYSNSSLVEPEIIEPKELRPEVQEFARQRKKQRASNKISSPEPEQVDEPDEVVKQKKKQRALFKPSPKVVEILDPITSNVIATKVMVKTDFKLSRLFSVLRLFTIKELRANYKAFKIDMKDECRRIRILKNRCMCELFIIMVFCGLGGFLFKFIEGTFENFYKCGVKRVKRDFIELLWTKSHNLREEDWKSLARNRLRIFEEELHTAHEAGMKTYSGQRAWSFLNAVVYCLSIVTTIGYGHIYPDTRTGKALTIVYAIIGIPLFLLALTDFGKLFTRCIKFFWSFVRRLYYTGSCRTVRKTAHVKEIFKGAQMMYEIATFRRPSMFVDPENPEESPSTTQIGDDTPTTPAISNFEIDDEFNLPISLAIFILVLYIFLGGLIYCLWEGWDFFDSFYFVFISMSTVGFGDMVPADAACMIVSIVYLVFGLALMSMCINVVQVKLSDTFKQASTKIGATIGITVSEDDGSIKTVAPDQVEIPEVHEIGAEPAPNTSSENDSNIQKENNQKKDS